MTSVPAGRFEWESALRRAHGVPFGLRAVLFTLATYATTTTGQDIRPSLSKLADTTGTDRRTWTRRVAEGVEAGWLRLIEDRSSRGQPNVYALTIPAVAVPPSFD